MSKTLNFSVLEKCGTTRARCGRLILYQSSGEKVCIETPVFMAVGTNGTMKGITPQQIESTNCRLILSNTYHLGIRCIDAIHKSKGLHSFMNWRHALLTDSGGFQMVSLNRLSDVSETGVEFAAPYDPDVKINLTPEKAIEIQHKIGANIMMQLDDVVSSTCDDSDRVQEAMHRSIRWYDRCREAHHTSQSSHQNLFPIIQGGLDPQLRRISVKEIVSRDSPGIAIGGLSGGEEKEKFIEMVHISTESLPAQKPRYLMGVGVAIDMLMCIALGCDAFDCVFPTRTARFGCALVGYGKQLDLKRTLFADDFKPICDECDCKTCANNSRSYIHYLMRERNTVGCHLLTVHNIRFQMRFMDKIRNAIKCGKFKEFIAENLVYHYETKDNYPKWINDALNILNLDI